MPSKTAQNATIKTRTSAIALALLLLTPMLSVPLSADFVCTRYKNTDIVNWGGQYGYVCADTGPGCTECINFHPGGVQWCHWGTPTDIYCIDQAY
jgi:hypothetical protein